MTEGASSRLPVGAVHIKTAHPGRVWAVATGVLADGRVVAVSGDGDGMVRVWDLATGVAVGEPLRGRIGPVRAVATGVLADGRVVAVSGDGDGMVRVWDLATGVAVGEPLRGRIGPVRAVATGVLADGRVVAVSGGDDGMVRVWDLATGVAVGEPLTGHIGLMWGVATGVLADGRVVAVSGDGDGMVRVWDLATGVAVGEPLTGHIGAVRAVATGVLADGRVVAVSGGDDGMVRVWDLATGVAVGEPLTGHIGAVRAVATGVLADGRVVAVSGGDDGMVRVWDLASGTGVGQPLTGHTGRVWAVATGVLADGRVVAVSGGDDGALVVWPLGGADVALGAGAPEPVDETNAAFRTEAPALVDTDHVRDELGREVLAAHLYGLLDQLTAEQDALSAVVHIDGRWGAGKSTLIRLLLERLRATDQHAVVDSGSAPAAGLRDPLVVRYDAWRESAIAPEWWSLATAINRAVRGARSRMTRAHLICWGVVLRTIRSPAVVAALGIFLMVLLVWRLGLRHGTADGLGKVVTALTGIAVLALAAGRLLFWYAPALGRLHLRTDDNPLGEIAAMVGWLRRWCPRDEERQRSRDRLVGAVLVFLASIASGGLWAWLRVVAHPVWWLPAAAVGAPLLIGGAIVGWHSRWSQRLGPAERRPLLLVIDDLDRCLAERVVKLLEAVHTLLRDPEAVRLSGWRSPARLVVLVLADGRWVRTAFGSAFSTFDSLGSAVHSVGADFAQKVFDHTVLVPELSADQVRDYVEAQLRAPAPTSSGTTAARVVRGAASTPAEIDHVRKSKQLADQLLAQIEREDPAHLRTEAMSARVEDPAITTQDRHRLEALRAEREASPKATASRSEHLLQQYTALMPANPRLVKRVANTFGMLLAVKGHLGHTETEEVVARAAIMFVRFPGLVDSLLSEPVPPVVDPSDTKEDSPWRRPDVQQLLAGVDIRGLARCFGLEYPPTPPESP